MSSTSGDTTPLEADFAAMRKLRDDDESGALKEFFGDGEDPREWKGGFGERAVTVKDGRVTKLDLTLCQSLAALPATIRELGSLKELILRHCSLTKLPDSIGELKALTTLRLEVCSSLVALPAAIGELGALTKLDLSSCSSLATLPAAIRGLGALTTLDLSSCSSLATLPDAIGELKALTKLDLQGCSSLVALPAAIGELKALTTLDLSQCSSLTALPAAIGELGALTMLNLDRCSNLAALPATIGELGALKELVLEWCTSLVALPDSIGKLVALSTLYLRGCSSLTYPPEEMRGDLHKIIGFCCLSLLESGNASAADVTESIMVHVIVDPAHDERLDALQHTDQAFADITKAAKAILEVDFTALRKLRDDDAIGALTEYFGDGEDPREWKEGSGDKTVMVSDGRVTKISFYKCTKLTALPAAIGELGALTTLDLHECSSLTALPAAIGKLKALTTLRLDECSSLPALPAAIGELGALTNLDLSECSKLVALPAAIGELGALTNLDLSKCLRLAALPDAIGELGVLEMLHLKNCFRLAKLPDSIGKLGALTKLYSSECSSLAKLPDSIGELKALTTLDLERCSSLVALPDATGELGALKMLNLSKCSSLVALPDSIGELGALTELNVQKCSSLTALPDAIGDLGALTKLDLSECSSLVALPAAIGELKALTELDLRSCSSLVALPESMAGLDALGTLLWSKCPKLTFPPPHIRGANAWRIKRFLKTATSILADDLSVADADDDVKASFLYDFITNESCADRLETALHKNPALADLTNDKGQRAIDLACVECREAMEKALMFLGRYAIADGPPEHRSATSLVVRALDYEAADDYGRSFDEIDDGDDLLDTDELNRLAAKLGTNVEILKLDGGSLTKDAFIAKCQRLFGKERKVVIKIFQVEQQWRNEKKARDDLGLDAHFVVQTIEAPGDDEFAKALGESALFQEDRFGGSVGSRAIVMDAADRNLFQIYQSERPDLNTVRVLMRQVMECVQHLHEKGLVHGDIKMLNIVRLSLDNKLRLIDLDAAAKISEFGSGDVSYVGSKFSSAVLPPECFAKLDTDQQKQFDDYFEHIKDEELRKKIAPKVDRRGASYVVKTFSLTEDGAPKRIDSLPYEPEEASVAVDYWSLGALLFQLVTKVSVVPANLDEDCVDGNAMAALASWNDDTGKSRLVAIKDAAAFDLATKLLVRDPQDRASFSISDALARHPFFNPESGDAEIIKKLGEMQTTLDSVKADTSAILKLSEENRGELRRTRDVLLKAVFEATEVTTPTTFVVLTDKLTVSLDEKKLKWIENNVEVKDDGSGVLIRGEPPSWWADVEARYKDGKAWADGFAKLKLDPNATPESAFTTIQSAFEVLLPKKTLYFYLVDELTGKPVEGPGYPIEITEPAKELPKLLLVMQVGMRAMSLYNGVAGVAQMFGYPVPKVPGKWRKVAKDSVDLLKQKSSVAAFGAVHKKMTDKDEASKSVRGVSLRELEDFFKKEDAGKKYAGLRRIGDPNDGTAVWTCLEGDKFEQALTERTKEWRAENGTSETKRPLGPKAGAVLGDGATAHNDDPGPRVGSQAANESLLREMMETQKLLAKNNGGTCNNSCHCAIA